MGKEQKSDYRVAAEAAAKKYPDLVERSKAGDPEAQRKLFLAYTTGAAAIQAAREAAEGQ